MKKLSIVKTKNSGRNFQGKITVRHRGGGTRLRYRVIDFKKAIFEVPAVVLNIEYDPNRTAFIALILYKNGILSYVNAVQNLKIGDFIISSKFAEICLGGTFPLFKIPLGTIISSIELNFGSGAKICRAAGSFGSIVARKKVNNKSYFTIVRFKSKEEYILYSKNIATIGVVSNPDRYLRVIKKAGVNRRLGVRPHVRGVAMNPIDHPHGGGEGKTSGGRPSVSKWGKLTKGVPTRLKKKKSIFLFKSRKFKN